MWLPFFSFLYQMAVVDLVSDESTDLSFKINYSFFHAVIPMFGSQYGARTPYKSIYIATFASSFLRLSLVPPKVDSIQAYYISATLLKVFLACTTKFIFWSIINLRYFMLLLASTTVKTHMTLILFFDHLFVNTMASILCSASVIPFACIQVCVNALSRFSAISLLRSYKHRQIFDECNQLYVPW